MLFRGNKINLFKKHINLFKPRKLFKNRSFFTKKDIEEIGKFNIKDFKDVNSEIFISISKDCKSGWSNNLSRKVLEDNTIDFNLKYAKKNNYVYTYFQQNKYPKTTQTLLIIKDIIIKKEGFGFYVYNYNNGVNDKYFSIYNDPDYKDFMYTVDILENDIFSFKKIPKNKPYTKIIRLGKEDKLWIDVEGAVLFEGMSADDVHFNLSYYVDNKMDCKISSQEFVDNNIYLDSAKKYTKNSFDDIFNFYYNNLTNTFTANIKRKLFGAGYLEKEIKKPINRIDFEMKFIANVINNTFFQVQIGNELLLASVADIEKLYIYNVKADNWTVVDDNKTFYKCSVSVENKTGNLKFFIVTYDDYRSRNDNDIELELKNIEIHYSEQDSLKTTIKDYDKKEVIGDERIGRISPPPKRIIVKGFND